MIATNEELALLEKWKQKLCLQEWRIKLLTHLHPEEMMVRNAAGCTEWSEAIKTARIEIINPACYGDRIVPFDFEKTLVHELLHLKFSFWCQNEDDVGDRVMHQMVLDNEQAKQLVDYAVKKEVYNWDGVEWIVTEAFAHGNKVVINADW